MRRPRRRLFLTAVHDGSFAGVVEGGAAVAGVTLAVGTLTAFAVHVMVTAATFPWSLGTHFVMAPVCSDAVLAPFRIPPWL